MEENVYAAPEVNVVDVVNDGGDYELATRGSRLGALMLEGLITGGIVVVLGLITGLISSLNYDPTDAPGPNAVTALTPLLTLLVMGIFWIINIVLLVKNGQTIGKKIVGIRIARPDDGRKASFGRIFGLRIMIPTIIIYIPIVGFIFALANILFIFGESRQCLHDKIADTVVVKC